MYAFLTKLIFLHLHKFVIFVDYQLRSFDKAGNYTFGLKEQLIFPEIDYDDVDQIQGLVTLVL